MIMEITRLGRFDQEIMRKEKMKMNMSGTLEACCWVLVPISFYTVPVDYYGGFGFRV